jgi:hypothetical protein
MVIALLIVLIFGVGALLAAVGLLRLHNRLSSSRAAAHLALSRLESECVRRGELLGRLMESARVFMHPQREVMEAVLQARHAVSRTMGSALARPADRQVFEHWHAVEQDLRGAFERFQSAAVNFPEYRNARHIAQLGGELQAVWDRVELFERAYNACAADFERLWNGVVCGLLARFLGYEAVPLIRAAQRQEPAVVRAVEVPPMAMETRVEEDLGETRESNAGSGRVFYG